MIFTLLLIWPFGLQMFFSPGVFSDPLLLPRDLNLPPSLSVLSLANRSFWPIFSSTHPLIDQHLLTRQIINRKNSLHKLETGDFRHEHYNAVSFFLVVVFEIYGVFFLFLLDIYFIYISDVIPFPSFPSKNLLSLPLPLPLPLLTNPPTSYFWP